MQRLGPAFSSARHYAEHPLNKWPGSNPLRNLLVNFKAFGLRPPPKFKPWRHPRERVLNTLALLLWEPEAAGSPEFPSRVAAYRRLWQQVK